MKNLISNVKPLLALLLAVVVMVAISVLIVPGAIAAGLAALAVATALIAGGILISSGILLVPVAIVFVITLLAVAVALIAGGVLIVPAVIAVGLTGCMWFRIRDGKKNADAMQDSLQRFESIIDGKVWRLKDAIVVHSYRSKLTYDSSKGGFSEKIKHLCKTETGHWFIFHAVVQKGRMIEERIEITDEPYARKRLQGEPEAYAQHFGEPVQA